MADFVKKLAQSQFGFYSVLLLLIGLVLSPFLNGMMHIVLFVYAIILLPFKFHLIIKDKRFLAFFFFYFILIIGITYTSDYSFAYKELRVKASFLLFPLLFSLSGGFNKKQWNLLLWILSLSIVIASFVSYYTYIQQPELDSREYSVFISHIRFSYIIVALLFFHLFELQKGAKFQYFYLRLAVFIYLLVYLLFLSSLSALFAFFFAGVYFILRYVKPKYRILFLFLTLLIPTGYVSLIILDYTPSETFEKQCDRLDLRGDENYYLRVKAKENGFYVGLNLKENELIEQWNLNHNEKIDSTKYGLQLKYTLVRYLTSLNLPKDSVGFNQLSDKEEQAILNGVANPVVQNKAFLYKRLYDLIWEIDRFLNKENVSGHSFTQRFVFWQIALDIIQSNKYFGVGTGDIPISFKQHYDKNPILSKMKFQLRTHNQYLSFYVAFGIIAGSLILFLLYYPFFKFGFKNRYLVLIFLLMSISMLTEDTFETQAGATFFALFYSLFLYSKIE